MQIAQAGDVSRAITAITDMFGSWGKVLLFLVSPHMLMTMRRHNVYRIVFAIRKTVANVMPIVIGSCEQIKHIR